LKVVKVDQLKSCLRFQKVRRAGDIIDVRKTENRNNKMSIAKISADEYVILETGEVKQFNRTADRSQTDYMKTSMDNLRSIINANCTIKRSCAWFTVTYRDNMTDHKQLMKDWEKFWKRLKYSLPFDLEYITAVEPQERGSWHMHVILIRTDGRSLYIPQKALLDMWGHGGVNIKRLEDSDNVGAYLTAYLTNTATLDADGSIDIKSIKKAMRLHLYPPKMKFYRTSKGIKIPEWVDIPDAQTKTVIESCTPNYRQIKEIIDDTDGNKRRQTIVYEQYNMKRQSNTKVVSK
jgi:hypothetical protein